MKKVYLLAILMIAILLPVKAQTFEEREKQFEEQFNNFKQKKEKEYRAFYERMNAEYANYLKRSWQKREMVKGEEKPKEESVPPVKYEGEKQKEKEQEAVVIEKPVVEPAPMPEIPEPVKPADYKFQKFSYYGMDLECRMPKDKEIHLSSTAPEAVAAAWTAMSDESYYNMIHDCLKLRDSLKLCDWAYLGMLDTLAHSICQEGNDATFMQAYLLCKSGYAMRFGNVDNHLIMLIGSKNVICGTNYFEIGDLYFYALGEDTHKVDVSDAKFDGEKPIELTITNDQLIMFKPTTLRQIKSEMGVEANCSVNHNMIDFFDKYPMSLMKFGNGYAVDWKLYASTPFDQEVSKELYSQLGSAIKGLRELDAVNIILNWVQTSFEYKLDDLVWGYDRAFFPSETLYYPYCDCEDRAILFSRIVRDLLKLDVALVYYPGHLAAAVKFNDKVKGDYIMAGDDRYVICDPTYIPAPVGLTMTRYRNTRAQLVKL